MRTRNTAVTLAVASALVLSACAGGGAASGKNGTVHISMVESLTNPSRTVVLKKLIGQFEAKNPTIKVDLISPPTDQADQKIQQMLQSGTGIDALEVRDTTVGAFSTNGWLYDMGPELKDWSGWADLTDNATRYSKDTKGRTFYIPYGFYGLTLYYRTDLTAKAGFSAPPASWDDLLTQASAIQKPDLHQYGYAFRGGKGGSNLAVAMIEAYVADKIDRDDAYKLTDGRTVFAAPEALDAMNTYLKLFQQASPSSSVAWGFPEMVQGFTNGSTAFLLQDPEVIATVGQSKAISTNQWNTAPLLTGPGGKACQPVGSAGWGTAASSKHKDETAKLVEFLAQGEASATFTKENGLVPVVKSAAADPFYKTGPWGSYLAMNQSPDKYLTVIQPRSVAWWSEWSQKADADVQRVLLGKVSTKDLLADWDAYWTEKRKNQPSQ
ncbi:sugar ABC transporter substrate-binding protein [Kitasatospora purpeofusca]|uniref:Sugar ABC transporter substrate-binding protein n=1 Tax=Kitasatospora purpeofusca TaxID=67352 RepID=A0ABZ1TWT7_9ACTN|nr:sugar ABC transporter substrate-binding protein [Kitasatospora purpeofusca]